VDLCGLPQKNGLDGESLAPLLKDPSLSTDPVISTFNYQNYSVRTDRWRFIRYQDGNEELYDHQNDPNEWRNLAGDENFAAVTDQLRRSLPASPADPVRR
jgi:hypothetical protein